MAGIRVSYSKISLHPALSIVQTDVSKPELCRCLAKIIFWGEILFYSAENFSCQLGTSLRLSDWQWLFGSMREMQNIMMMMWRFYVQSIIVRLHTHFELLWVREPARICKYRRLYIGQSTNLMKDYHRDVLLAYFDLLYRLRYCEKLGLLVIFVSLSR